MEVKKPFAMCIRVLQRTSVHTDTHSYVCVYIHMYPGAAEVTPVSTIKSRIAEGRALFLGKWGDRGEILLCSLPLSVKAVLLINLGVLDCPSSESE